jgi:hypothetical protein
MIKMTEEELLHADQMVWHGIPLDGEVLAETRAAWRGLSIDQSPNNIETCIFDSSSGGIGVLLGLVIWNNSDRTIRVDEARLQISCCKQIRWLDDPFRKAPRKYCYMFPSADCLEFDRDVVLNHRFGPQGRLRPDKWLDGLLLGMGEGRIPDEYDDRQCLPARLSVFDGRGKRYDADVKFLVSRDRKHRQRRKAIEDTQASSPAGRASESCVSTPWAERESFVEPCRV